MRFWLWVMPSPQHQRERTVREIFNGVAGRYDLLNRVISFHFDTLWRRQAVNSLHLAGLTARVLDLGTGTGDLALAAAAALGPQGKVLGLDFAPEMLRLAKVKSEKHPCGGKTRFVLGSAVRAPFRSDAFDAVMTAFVLRNVSDLSLFFVEAHRVLKPGGRVAALDMFPPSKGLFSCIYALYFYHLVPWIGAGLARRRDAYGYLSQSVKGFMAPEAVADIMREAGFQSVRIKRFLRGAVCLHVAEKPVER